MLNWRFWSSQGEQDNLIPYNKVSPRPHWRPKMAAFPSGDVDGEFWVIEETEMDIHPFTVRLANPPVRHASRNFVRCMSSEK